MNCGEKGLRRARSTWRSTRKQCRDYITNDMCIALLFKARPKAASPDTRPSPRASRSTISETPKEWEYVQVEKSSTPQFQWISLDV